MDSKDTKVTGPRPTARPSSVSAQAPFTARVSAGRPPDGSPGRRHVARLGEALARQHLIEQGWRIEAINWACPPLGELDLIAEQGDVLAIVEVRTRKRADAVPPQATVLTPKQRKIIRTADVYVQQRPTAPYTVRFDVIGITLEGEGGPNVTWIQGAFTPAHAF